MAIVLVSQVRGDRLAAASDLFKNRGYDTTSVDDIAEAADVAKGTFYYHFEKKMTCSWHCRR
jgi:AcrR family transcriptional regulator